ncbi:MAG: DsbA family oxidoreductase [Senegalia sp. (in: firmicutes)]|uniref:DsbA family oxidoreductase n=1 Tax=Senegalia sp. (in: firmicutes) TaxID=1924098 RepID=UPI003F9AA68B
MGLGIVEKLKKEYEINDIWIPYELNPNTPKEGVQLKDKFSPEKMKEMKKELDRKTKELDIEFYELEFTSNSHNAFKVSELAKLSNKFHEFHKRVYEANFREGQNIYDREVLAILGEDVGLEKQDVYDAIDSIKYEETLLEYKKETDLNNIDTTPTFVINNKEIVVGSQPLDFFREKFDKINR